ncbi:MAG: glycoside hydrolase family 3 protein [Treponema sp.]
MKNLSNKKHIASIIFFFLFIIHCHALPNFYDDEEPSILAEKIANAMTDEELLSQIFMFGWKGESPDSLLFNWIEKRGLGNIKIFGWNTKDSKKLGSAIADLQKRAINGRFNIPLFVATDQEGGLVRHVKGLAMHTPGNLSLGASSIYHDAYMTGYYISMELRTLGINLNFAPAVDLYTNYNSSVIGIRSFSESPEVTAKLSVAFMKGARKAGVLSTAKHFPGHGDTQYDSHGRLPKIAATKETLISRELVPFQALIDAKVPAIMTAHINFPALAEQGEPATFSKYILTGLLRDELGFNGIIITDDIMMNGATSYVGGLAIAVQKAIEAGNNIVESSRTPFLNEEVWKHNIKLMKENEEFYLCVKDSVKRVLMLKLNYFKSKNHVPIFPDIETIDQTLPNSKAEDFFVGMAARSITIVRGSLPLYSEDSKDRLMIASSTFQFLEAGRQRFPKARISNLVNCLENAQVADSIIFCLEDMQSLETLQALISAYPKKKYIVVSAMSPIYLQYIPDAQNVIATYSNSPFSFLAVFSAIAGDFVPSGKMPLDKIK